MILTFCLLTSLSPSSVNHCYPRLPLCFDLWPVSQDWDQPTLPLFWSTTCDLPILPRPLYFNAHMWVSIKVFWIFFGGFWFCRFPRFFGFVRSLNLFIFFYFFVFVWYIYSVQFFQFLFEFFRFLLCLIFLVCLVGSIF